MCTYFTIQFEQFAENLEQSFIDLGKKLHSFKNKVTVIKQSYAFEQSNKKYKNSMFKRDPRPKKKRVKTEFKLSAKEEQDKSKEQFIVNYIDVNTLDLDDITQPNKAVDLTGTLNQTLDFDINEWFIQEGQTSNKSSSFKQFYNLQSNRIKKSDPLASQAEVNKFIQDKWEKMSQLQRSRFIQNENKKIQVGSSKSTKKPLQTNKDEELQLNKFNLFLNRKITKSTLPIAEPPKSKNQKIEKVQTQQNKYSASQLLNALLADPSNKQPKRDSKLDWIFQNFQF